MADSTPSAGRPAFVGALQSLQIGDLQAVLKQEHPQYIAHKTSWSILLDAFEGSGGFLDGSYLWPYPREEQKYFEERQTQARYHNYLETLVDLYVRFIFTQGVKRDSKNKDFNAWLSNVDGAGTTINELLKRLASVALVAGHGVVLMDKTRDEAQGQTQADETARVIAHVFTASGVTDWRYDGAELVGVKLLERAPEPSIAEPLKDGEAGVQFLLWDTEGWARFSADGDYLDSGLPDLGLVPVVVLRPKASQTSMMLGRPLVSNANVVRALFNRASEQDETLRGQAFSVLAVSVPPDGDVDKARQDLGNAVGVAKALVVRGQIDYKTPSMEVPKTIGDNIDYLVREMYRAAHVHYEQDSLAAQSGDSIRLQYTELNEMLQGFAKSLSHAESQIARAWFAWMFPTPEAGQAAYEAAAPTASYPDEFFLDALMNDLAAYAEGLTLGLGDTMSKRIKKRAARRIDPDMPQDMLEAVDGEIDAQTSDELKPMGMQQPPQPPDTGQNTDQQAIDAARQQGGANG